MENKEMEYVTPMVKVVEINARTIICTSGEFPVPSSDMDEGDDNL